MGSSPRPQAAPGTTCLPPPGSHPHPSPSAAATHSHHGRHRSTRVLTHFIVETIPARAEEAGEGKWEGSVGKKENSCVNMNYFLKNAQPSPPPPKRKNKNQNPEVPGLSSLALTLNRPCFPSLASSGRGH